jgi:hypothetical protein
MTNKLTFQRTLVRNLDMKEIKLFTKHLSKTLPLWATERLKKERNFSFQIFLPLTFLLL